MKDFAIEYDKYHDTFVLVHPETRKVMHTTNDPYIAAKIALSAGTHHDTVKVYADGLTRVRMFNQHELQKR